MALYTPVESTAETQTLHTTSLNPPYASSENKDVKSLNQ